MTNIVIKLVVAFFLSNLALVPDAVASNDLLKKFYERERKLSKLKDKDFSLEAELGFLAADGNTNTTTFKSSLTSEHELEKWSNRYFVEFIYKRNESTDTTEGRVTAQRFQSSVQLDYKLANTKDRFFMYAEYDDDRFNGFRYQAAVAAGYSTTAWKTEDAQFRYSIGPGYSYSQKEHKDLGDKRYFSSFKEAILRASIDYRYKISDNAKFRQFLSAEAGEENKRSRSETSVTADVLESLAMKLSFVMLYNNADFLNNDNLSTEASISLVYQFF